MYYNFYKAGEEKPVLTYSEEDFIKISKLMLLAYNVVAGAVWDKKNPFPDELEIYYKVIPQCLQKFVDVCEPITFTPLEGQLLYRYTCMTTLKYDGYFPDVIKMVEDVGNFFNEAFEAGITTAVSPMP